MRAATGIQDLPRHVTDRRAGAAGIGLPSICTSNRSPETRTRTGARIVAVPGGSFAPPRAALPPSPLQDTEGDKESDSEADTESLLCASAAAARPRVQL